MICLNFGLRPLSEGNGFWRKWNTFEISQMMRLFSWILVFQVLSALGTQLHFLALGFLTQDITQSSVALGWVLAIPALAALLAPFIPWTTEGKLSRLSALDFVAAVGVFGIAASISYPAALVGSVVIGFSQAFYRPGLFHFISKVLPEKEISRANGLLFSTEQVAVLFAHAVSGSLLSALGPRPLFLLDGASYLICALGLLFLGLRLKPRSETSQAGQGPTTPPSAKTKTSPGWKALTRSPVWAGLFALCILVNLSFSPLPAILFLQWKQPEGMGWLLAALGLGNLVGNGIRPGQAFSQGPWGVLFLTLAGSLPFFGLALGQASFALQAPLLFLLGVFVGVFGNTMMGLLQKASSDSESLISVFMNISRAIQPVAILGVTWLGSQPLFETDTRKLFFIPATTCLIGASLILAWLSQKQRTETPTFEPRL